MSGARGPRGHRGALGPQAAIDPAGARRETGRTSKGDSSTSGAQVLAEINRHIEDIYQALDIQMKRIGQMQVQIDELRKKLLT